MVTIHFSAVLSYRPLLLLFLVSSRLAASTSFQWRQMEFAFELLTFSGLMTRVLVLDSEHIGSSKIVNQLYSICIWVDCSDNMEQSNLFCRVSCIHQFEKCLTRTKSPCSNLHILFFFINNNLTFIFEIVTHYLVNSDWSQSLLLN